RSRLARLEGARGVCRAVRAGQWAVAVHPAGLDRPARRRVPRLPLPRDRLAWAVRAVGPRLLVPARPAARVAARPRARAEHGETAAGPGSGRPRPALPAQGPARPAAPPHGRTPRPAPAPAAR